MSAMPHTNDSTEKSTPDASEGRKARSVRNTVTQKQELTPWLITAYEHGPALKHSSSVTWVFQVSILNKPTGAGLTNADACTHQSALALPHFSLPLYPSHSTLDIHGFTWHSFL